MEGKGCNMTGGDSRVSANLFHPRDDLDLRWEAHRLKIPTCIDAHSVQAGDFQLERTIGKKKMYFTEKGAEAIDALKQNFGPDVHLSVQSDLKKIPEFLNKVLGRRLGSRFSHRLFAEDPSTTGKP